MRSALQSSRSSTILHVQYALPAEEDEERKEGNLWEELKEVGKTVREQLWKGLTADGRAHLPSLYFAFSNL